MSPTNSGAPVIWGVWSTPDRGNGRLLVQTDSYQGISAAADILTSDYRVHKRLLAGLEDDVASYQPHMYVRYPTYEQGLSSSSSSSMQALARSYYERAGNTLRSLMSATDDEGEPVVEAGAIDTAVAVLGQLQMLEYAPPELSWHGGDAVVMLWANTDTTFAITVTDGEWGYIARRNGKQIKLAHSIKLSTLALKDLR